MVPRTLRFQPEPIEDPADPRVADFFALNDPELRRRWEQPGDGSDGFFVAEGALVIRQLLRSQYPLRSVLLTARGRAALEDVCRRSTPPSTRFPSR